MQHSESLSIEPRFTQPCARSLIITWRTCAPAKILRCATTSGQRWTSSPTRSSDARNLVDRFIRLRPRGDYAGHQFNPFLECRAFLLVVPIAIIDGRDC